MLDQKLQPAGAPVAPPRDVKAVDNAGTEEFAVTEEIEAAEAERTEGAAGG